MQMIEMINSVRDSLEKEPLISDPCTRLTGIDLVLKFRLKELEAVKEDIVKLLQLRAEVEAELQEDNRCVACGHIVPEGRQVCPNCERRIL